MRLSISASALTSCHGCFVVPLSVVRPFLLSSESLVHPFSACLLVRRPRLYRSMYHLVRHFPGCTVLLEALTFIRSDRGPFRRESLNRRFNELRKDSRRQAAD